MSTNENTDIQQVMMNEKLFYADLHAHLGASVSPALMYDIAHENGIRLEYKDYFEFYNAILVDDKMNHKDYLYKFQVTHRIQNSPNSIVKSVYGAISGAYRKQRLDLLELRFNPMKRNGLNREYDLEAVFLSAIFGMKKASLAYPGIKVGLIIETDREFTGEQSMILAEKAVKFKNEGVIGFDISGFSKPDFNINDHTAAFNYAKKCGLNITCHTGEVTSSKEVIEFIEKLMPNRIGHGIQIWKDEEAMNFVSRNDVVLEICPTSNIKTGIVSNYKAFKEIFDSLRIHDVKFTINSDGPIFLQSSVYKEFERLVSYGAMDWETVKWCCNNAKEATFIK